MATAPAQSQSEGFPIFPGIPRTLCVTKRPLTHAPETKIIGVKVTHCHTACCNFIFGWYHVLSYSSCSLHFSHHCILILFAWKIMLGGHE